LIGNKLEDLRWASGSLRPSRHIEREDKGYICLEVETPSSLKQSIYNENYWNGELMFCELIYVKDHRTIYALALRSRATASSSQHPHPSPHVLRFQGRRATRSYIFSKPSSSRPISLGYLSQSTRNSGFDWIESVKNFQSRVEPRSSMKTGTGSGVRDGNYFVTGSGGTEKLLEMQSLQMWSGRHRGSGSRKAEVDI